MKGVLSRESRGFLFAILTTVLFAFALSASAEASSFANVGSSPRGIALDSSGNIYTANYGSNNISKVTPGGSSSSIASTESGPSSIAIDGQNNVYSANRDSAYTESYSYWVEGYYYTQQTYEAQTSSQVWVPESTYQYWVEGYTLSTSRWVPAQTVQEQYFEPYTYTSSQQCVRRNSKNQCVEWTTVYTITGGCGCYKTKTVTYPGYYVTDTYNVPGYWATGTNPGYWQTVTTGCGCWKSSQAWQPGYTATGYNYYNPSITRVTSAGSASSAFARLDQYESAPEGITTDSSGTIYTANTASNNVSSVSSGGSASNLFGTGSSPVAVVVDSQGNIYSANRDANSVTKRTSSGSTSTISLAGGNSPRDLAVDSSGNVYTANCSSNNVTKITPAGAASILGNTGSCPHGIAVDSSGNVYTANYNANNVTRIKPDGTSVTLGSTGSQPRDIVVDSTRGYLYTANEGAGTISRISTVPPANTSAPTISGTARVGQTLSMTSEGTWNSDSTPTLTRQWQACQGAGGTGCTDIAGATGTSYTLTAAEAGKFIRLVIIATTQAGSVSNASSTSSAVLAMPVNSTVPTLSRSGNTFTTTNGSWDGDPTSYTYKWQRCLADGTSCADIANATSSSYTITADDEDKRLRSQIVATNSSGDSSPASSALTSVIDTTAPLKPTIFSKPDLKSIAAGALFSWNGAEAGGSYQCQIDNGAWSSCSSPKSYTLTQLSVGERTFRVRQIDAAGNTGASESYTWIVGAKEELDFTGVSAQSSQFNLNNFFTGQAARINFRNGIQNSGRLAITAYKKDLPVMPTFPVTPRGFRLGSTPVYMTFQKLNGFQPGANMEICLDVPAGSITTGTPTLYRNPNTSGDAANWIKLNSTYTPGVSGADGKVCANTDDFSTYAVGSTPDPPTISAKPSALSNTTSASFSFTGEAANTFECQIDGGGFSACTSPKSYSNLSQGSHTFQVKQIDPATEAASEVASYTWEIDSIAPSAPTLSNTYSNTNDTTPTWSWTGAEEGGSYQCKIDSESWQSCSSPYTSEPLAEGAHTFRVRQVDAAGNAGEVDVDNITVDITASNTSIDNQPSDPSNSTSASFSFSSNESGVSFECKLDEGDWETCSSPKSYENLSDGSHTFQVQATDAAGNTDASPASYTWTVDTSAPSSPNIAAQPNDPTDSTSAAFSFTGENAASFKCSLNDPDLADASTCSSPVSYSSLSAGINTFRVWQTDLAGNTSASPASYAWEIDTTAPAAPTLSNTYSNTNDTTPTWSWTGAEEGGSYQCKIDSGPWETCSSPYTPEALSEGAHTFRVRQVDAAGNAGEVDADNITVNDVTVDTTAPNTNIDNQPSDPSNSTSASFSFSSNESGVSFECKLDEGDWETCSSPKSYENLSDGSHTFQVQATDAAGNTDASPASYTFTIDTLAPEAPAITSGPSGPIKQTAASFAFTSSDGITTECKLNDSDWAKCQSPALYLALTDGQYTFSLRALDAARNISEKATRSFTVDTEDPASPTITSKPSALSNDSSPSFSFTGEGGASFECSLDQDEFSPCTSPRSYAALTDGQHTFRVRQIDSAGNIGQTSSETFTVDTLAPEAPTITSKPTNPTGKKSASFAFTGEPGGSFECRLNSEEWSSCTSGKSYNNLAQRSHTFAVRQTDDANNTSSASFYAWLITDGSENTSAASVSVESALELSLDGTSDFSNVVKDSDLENLSGDSTLSASFFGDLSLRSNATWSVSLDIASLTATTGATPIETRSNESDLGLDSTEDAGNPNENNTYQDAKVSATADISWATNAGLYTGATTITAVNGY